MSRLEEMLKFDVDIKEMSRECDRCGKELKYGNKEIQTISCQGPVFYVCKDCKNKIINFIANILKWGKYFAPVLVIILSIFDFIKAIAAQKDEDMKKSQERFVKRLIAAALLFIVPFLIYFVLDKFNLINNDPYCGLFK